jgi:hypothetical protein
MTSLPQDILAGRIDLLEIRRMPPDEFGPLKAEILKLVQQEKPEVSENYGGVQQWTLFSPVPDMSVPMKKAMATVGKIQFHHADKYPLTAKLLAENPELMTCRIIGVQPGGGVPAHKDANVAGGIVISRFHLPIQTADGIDMELGGKLVKMEEGVVYLFNFGLEHRSLNRSQTTRLHMIWDLPLIPEVCERLTKHS